MRGIKKGSQTSSSKPILQLFARQDQLLKDIDNATYTIEDITGSTPSTVASGSIDVATNKLGTGRYWVPTGDTSSWNVGTHRVILTYAFSAGGETYTQVHEFEVLDPTEFPDDTQFVAYATTKRLQEDLPVSGLTTAKLQRLSHQAARQIEFWTQRHFDPRYRRYEYSPRDSGPRLFLSDPIIGIESVQTVYVQSDGTESLTTIDPTTYSVYNRHLRGLLDPDDRSNPKIELKRNLESDTGEPVDDGNRRWSWGSLVIRVQGVFGYTDPGLEGDGVSVGETPIDIKIVSVALVDRLRQDPSLSSMGVWSPGRITKLKTRDQEIQFSASSGNVSFVGGLSGDPVIDQRLVPYVAPPRAQYVHRVLE